MSDHSLEVSAEDAEYWPGYVDAISTLVINLLFIVCILAVSIMGKSIEISRMVNRPLNETVQPPSPSESSQTPAQTRVDTLQAENTRLRRDLDDKTTQLTKLLAATPKTATTVSASAQPSAISPKSVSATQEHTPSAKPQATAVEKSRRTIVVQFNPSAINLQQSEVTVLNQKLEEMSDLKAKEWLIEGASIQGLSEDARLAYYRVNAVRNALLSQGINAQQIKIRLTEGQAPAADSSRILVIPLP